MTAKAVQQITVNQHNSNILAWQMIFYLVERHRPVRTSQIYSTTQLGKKDDKYRKYGCAFMTS